MNEWLRKKRYRKIDLAADGLAERWLIESTSFFPHKNAGAASSVAG